jgi:glycosyltransferase involved in cell wall biosynthesis
MSKSLTILVPTYNEESIIDDCAVELERLILSIINVTPLSVQVLFIDNYSSDSTWEKLQNICSARSAWRAVQLDRNYGIQASLLRGMSLCETDGLLVFQSDLQDPIDTALELVKLWLGGARVAAGITDKRAENLLDRMSRATFYKILEKTSDFGLQPWFHDFYVLDRQVYTTWFQPVIATT